MLRSPGPKFCSPLHAIYSGVNFVYSLEACDAVTFKAYWLRVHANETPEFSENLEISYLMSDTRVITG